MDRRNTYFIAGGAAAVGFYSLLVLLLILFFNDYKQSKRYVPKKAHTIEVSLTSAPPAKPRPKPVEKKEQKKRIKAKAPAVAKKAASRPAPKPKKAPARPKAIASLFEKVKVAEPTDSRPARLANAPKIKYEATAEEEQEERRRAERLVRDINLSKTSIKMASKAGGEGEVDAYMSKLYEILYGSWQPEAVYAGQAATVRLTIAPEGSFNYRVLYPSDNQGFNESLIEYLDTLQKRGFPPHKRGKPLTIDVEFKAKE
ncbi:TonB C-terminal domain-containing protein [Hydrogenimonas sp.]